jgi:hypothetical protein
MLAICAIESKAKLAKPMLEAFSEGFCLDFFYPLLFVIIVSIQMVRYMLEKKTLSPFLVGSKRLKGYLQDFQWKELISWYQYF